jgi:serine/threonine-protein kinase RsbT
LGHAIFLNVGAVNCANIAVTALATNRHVLTRGRSRTMTKRFAATKADFLIAIRHESDIAIARLRVSELGLRQGLREARAAALATAVTEIARNILLHAKSGEISLSALSDEGRGGVAVSARDWGPGIPDIAQAMQDGYSTAGGLGLGLAGARRLVDEFEIASSAGAGVTVTLKQWAKPIARSSKKPT